MSAECLPIYILKWRPPANSKGRKHMAIYLPNPDIAKQHPLAQGPDISSNSKGLVIHAVGAPQTGYLHEFKRNFDTTSSARLESATCVGWLRADLVPVTGDGVFVQENEARGTIDRLALQVRAPGPSSNLNDPDTIRDCQDWVYDFFTYLVQKRVLGNEVPQTVAGLFDSKDSYLPKQTQQTSTVSQQRPQAQQVITASTVQSTKSATANPSTPAVSKQSAVQSRPGAPRIGASEWDAQRRAYKRYNYGTGQWELHDPSRRTWVPWT